MITLILFNQHNDPWGIINTADKDWKEQKGRVASDSKRIFVINTDEKINKLYTVEFDELKRIRQIKNVNYEYISPGVVTYIATDLRDLMSQMGPGQW